ncbi:MAG: hypothetical protein M5U28_27160 [Sandaracinaceae bacterium]|nr:hypothetical protein [Sandaracinaceae bacterium]
MSGDEEARARQLALKRAKRAAHDWARAVRSREEDKPDPWARLLAAELADRATLITKEVAEAHALPRECIGTVAAWPGPALLGASVGLHGPHGERYVRRHLKRLKSAGDVVPVDRRHLHQSTVYVLAAAGRPIGATNPDDSDDSDRTQESGRSEGDRHVSPVGGSTGQFGGSTGQFWGSTGHRSPVLLRKNRS